MVDIYLTYVKLKTVYVLYSHRIVSFEGDGVVKPFQEVEKHVFVLPLEDAEEYFLTIKKIYPHVRIYEEKSDFKEEGQEDFQEGQQSQLNEFSPCQQRRN